MAAANKFNDFVDQLGLAKHNLNTDTLNVMLTLTAPVATNSIKSDLTEIAAGNGYTAGGQDTQNTWAEASGTGTMTGTKVVWTASGGAIANFRYVALYNDTQTSPVDPLVLWWDNGSTVTLASGETFSVKFNNSDTTGSILTIA
jgi:hypothetical protein